jgi:hypothetical protein
VVSAEHVPQDRDREMGTHHQAGRSESRCAWAPAQLDPEIGPLHARVRQQCVVRAVQRDPAGFQHVAVIAGFERLDYALLDQKNGEPTHAVDLANALEDRIGHRRRKSHRGLVEHEELVANGTGTSLQPD